MLSIADAQAIVLRHAPGPSSAEPVPTLEAVGRVLARDVVSDLDQPPFDRATMDGFAVSSADAGEPGATLEIRGESAAGVPMAGRLERGFAARIFTGAVIPAGADAVVRVEDTREEAGRVVLQCAVRPGQNITRRGEFIAKGEVALQAGEEVSAAHVGMLLSLGAVELEVHARPRVAIVATGSELVDPSDEPGDGCIRESNSGALAAMVTQAGGCPLVQARASDREDEIEARVAAGLEHDVVLVTGGSPVGDYDFTPRILERLGVRVHFDRVAMKPGKPTIFGTRDDRVVFGLPGNPVSAFVAYVLFVRPALKRRLGVADPSTPWLRARLQEDLRRNASRDQVLPARLRLDSDGRLEAGFAGWRGSGDVTCLRRADALLHVPMGEGTLRRGEEILVTPIDGARAGDTWFGADRADR